MKWINPGYAALFDRYNVLTQNTSDSDMDGFPSFFIDWQPSFLVLKTVTPCREMWLSFNMLPYSKNDAENGNFLAILDAEEKVLVYVGLQSRRLQIQDANSEQLYITDKSIDFSEAVNIEVHFKQGENGRIDVWVDNKLFCSYRTPSAFNNQNQISKFKLANFRLGGPRFSASTIIYQDTRRIGLEKFKMLTVDPATEQNMPQGSTTNFTVSGLSDASEFSDITSFGVLMQTTSKDANITTGTFSLNGAEIGTIDVSDSSGKAYEIAHSETNSLTGKPWTRDDIEGKTLSFTVNGAT